MNYPLLISQLEILRRISEAGLKQSQDSLDENYIDIFQHLLDEIYRMRVYLEVDE